MNGAESLVRTLRAGGVDTCFANPGTSEMHFVSSLDSAGDGMRCVLCLSEGVVTGAADGYGRMAGKPAATLLHLGPGLANGLANLHNARRAASPIINIVGDHPAYHLPFNAPLTSDIEALARPMSDWVRTASTASSLAGETAEALVAANTAPGQIATLILPADCAWGEAEGAATVPAYPQATSVATATVDAIAGIVKNNEPTLLLLTGPALSLRGQLAAGRIAAATGCEILAQTSNARMERGAGCVAIDRVPYPVDQACERLKQFKHVVLVGTKEPVAFFAYPDKPSRLLPDGCQLHTLAEPGEDSEQALEWLSEVINAGNATPQLETFEPPGLPTGTLSGSKIAAAVAALLPENAIIADESVSLGRGFFAVIRNAQPHSWLQITGGAIGLGLPMATGAAIACPDRKVISLQADGSALYTVQALWTQARENLDITTVILSNRAYAILKGELQNLKLPEPGATVNNLFELQRPSIDWVSLAQGFGVEAGRATTADEFNALLERGLATPGPYLIEAML